MRFYTQQPNHYCGIDLQAKARYVCILDQSGMKLVHKHLPTTPAAFLRAIAPYREAMVGGGECLFPWYGLADLCAKEGSAFGLGPALSRKAMHGGQAKNDTSDAHKSAVLLRGGRFPLASGYPPERRATRDLLRRRCPLMRQRAALRAHIQNTHSQYNLPGIGKQRASKANRAGVEEHFPAPRGRKTIEMDGSLLDHSDKLWGEGALDSTRPAKGHDAQRFARLPSVPGSGQLWALVLLYEIPNSARFPRVQDFRSYGRLVTGAQESAGNRDGLSGKKIGNPHLTWAFSEAAPRFLRQNQLGKEYFAKLEHKHGKGKALTVLAQKLARAVYCMRSRHQAVARTRLVSA